MARGFQGRRFFHKGTGYWYVRPRGVRVAVPEHRLVMEATLDRKLLPRENVHHRNGIKTDNRPENLELWSTWQPYGSRVEDLVKFAREVLALYT